MSLTILRLPGGHSSWEASVKPYRGAYQKRFIMVYPSEKGMSAMCQFFSRDLVAVLALKPNAETCPICTSLPSTGLVPPIHEDDALAHVQACIELAQDNMLWESWSPKTSKVWAMAFTQQHPSNSPQIQIIWILESRRQLTALYLLQAELKPVPTC